MGLRLGRMVLSLLLVLALALPQVAFGASAKIENDRLGQAMPFNVVAGNPTSGYTTNPDNPHPSGPTLANSAKVGYAGHEWVVIGYNGQGVASNANEATLLLASNDGNKPGTTRYADSSVVSSNRYTASDLKTVHESLIANSSSFIDTSDGLLAKETSATYLKVRSLDGNSGLFSGRSLSGDKILSSNTLSGIATGITAETQYVNSRGLLDANTTFDWFAYDNYRKNIFPSVDGGFSYSGTYHPDRVAGSTVDAQKLWPLSNAETSLLDNSIRSYSATWWLRSPGSSGTTAADVPVSGVVNTLNSVESVFAVRPALNLNLANVAFTSASAGGKAAASVGGGFADAAATAPGDKIKFTMEDTTGQNLNIIAPTDFLSPKSPTTTNTIKFNYGGATIGDNQYVSAVLKQNGKIKYYAKLASAATDASGTAEASLAGVTNGEYKLEIFSEQANGANNTDFCSEVQEFNISVDNTPVAPTANLDYVNEAVTGLDVTSNPQVGTWFYQTTEAVSNTWTSFTPSVDGVSTLASLSSTPPANGLAGKNLRLAYNTQAGAAAPNSYLWTRLIKARPKTPTGIGGEINRITGVVANGTQEYQRSGDSTWTTVTTSPQSTGSIAGTFYVRTKATTSDFASANATVTVLTDATFAINGGADMTFTYPDMLEAKVKAASVSPSSGTKSWYYSSTEGAEKSTFTSGFPNMPGTYWVYAKQTASGIYAALESATVKVTWNKEKLDVSPDFTFTKVYDRGTGVTLPEGFPALTMGDSSGQTGAVEPGDNVNILGPNASKYSYAHATVAGGANSVSTLVSGFTLSGNAAGGTDNASDYYTLGAPTDKLTWSATITPAPAAVSFAGMAFTKTYDGTSVATNSGSAPSASGIIGDDTVTLNSGSARYFYGTSASAEQTNAGVSLKVYLTSSTYNTFTLTGANASNYSLSQPNQAMPVSSGATITPKVIDTNTANYDSSYAINWYFGASTRPENITSTSPTPSVVYTGGPHTIRAEVKASALVSTEDDVVINLGGDTNQTEPGNYTAKTTDTGDTALGGLDGANYVLSNALAQDWAIAGTLPHSPHNLSTDSGTSTAVKLSWSAPTFDGGSDVTNYQVEYMEVSDVSDIPGLTEENWAAEGAATRPALIAASSTEATVDLSSGIVNDKTYAWRVRASNISSASASDDSQWGPWSVPSSAKPDTTAPALDFATAGSSLTCTYGQTLGDIIAQFASKLKATGTVDVSGVYTNGGTLPGTWSWRAIGGVSDATIPSNNDPGTTDTFTLLFAPDATVAHVYGANTMEVTINITRQDLTIDYDGMTFERQYNGGTSVVNGGSEPSIETAITIDGDMDGSPDDVQLSTQGVAYVYGGTNAANAGTGKSVYLNNGGANYALVGTDAANYSFAVPTKGTSGTAVSTSGVISPRSLNFAWTLDSKPITAADASNSVTFDNANHSVVASASNVVDGESIAVDYGSTKDSGKNAASYQAKVVGITVSGGSGVAANYKIDVPSATQNWQIAKKAVNVQWVGSNFEYNASTQMPQAVYTAIAGDSGASALTVSTSGPRSAGGAVDAGDYTALASLPSDANYALTGTTTRDFSITPKTLTLDFSGLTDKLAALPYSAEVYIEIAKDTMPVLHSGSGAGKVYASDKLGTDVVLTVGNARWHLSSADIGGPYDLNIDGDFGLEGSRANNYVLTPGSSWSVMPGAAKIAPRPLEFAWEVDGKAVSGSAVELPHDGALHSVNATVTNALSGQVLKVDAYSASSVLSATDAGNYSASVASVVGVGGSGSGGVDLSKYTLDGGKNVTLAWKIVKEDVPEVPLEATVASLNAAVKTIYVQKGKTVKIPYVAYAVDSKKNAAVDVEWTATKAKIVSVGGAKATVKKGVVKSGKLGAKSVLKIKAAKKIGTTKVTLSVDGKKLVFTIKVVKSKKAVKSFKLNKVAKLKAGKTKALKVTKITKGATGVLATFTIAAKYKKYLTVDAAGKLTAISTYKKGKKAIPVKVKVGSKAKTLKVKVVK